MPSTKTIAVVTGGSRGIGFSIAKQLAGKLSAVALISRNESSVKHAVEMLREEGGEVYGYSCDVSDPKQVEKCISDIQKKAAIKYLVNAAGVCHDGLLMRYSDINILETIGVNLLGPIYMSRASMKDLMRNNGSILNIGSVVGSSGNAGQSVYSASKSGLVGLTKSLAKEMGSKRVRVNLIEPGYIDTDMTSKLNRENLKDRIPLGRFGTPEEVAGLAEYILLSSTSEYITGQVFRVDGGLL